VGKRGGGGGKGRSIPPSNERNADRCRNETFRNGEDDLSKKPPKCKLKLGEVERVATREKSRKRDPFVKKGKVKSWDDLFPRGTKGCWQWKTYLEKGSSWNERSTKGIDARHYSMKREGTPLRGATPNSFSET